MNVQKTLHFCLIVCSFLFVTACSKGPEILFIKIDWNTGGPPAPQNTTNGGFKNYTFHSNQSRKIGQYYKQIHSGFGGFATTCGSLVPPAYTTIVNRSRTESVSFKIKQEVWGNTEGNGGPLYKDKINYISYTLEPLQSLSMNVVNSCFYMLNKPFGVRSKFKHSIKSATVIASGSDKYIQNLKNRKENFKVTNDSSCQSYCKDNWCLPLPFDTQGKKQAVNRALIELNSLLHGDTVSILDIQNTLHIKKTNCSISDLVAVERGFEANGNQCSFQTKGSNFVDFKGKFPDVFKLGVTIEPNKDTYTFSPSIPLLFEGGSEQINNALNSKFSAGLSSIEVTPSKIFVGSGSECLMVNIK
jgi:hypothetical protein